MKFKADLALNAITSAIKKSIFENKTFVAGGYVRDKIIGRYSDDIDIVVNIENGGLKLAEFLHEKGLASKPVLYKTFGTAKTVISGYSIEFVMTRKESYRTSSRFPSVDFGSIEEDVIRRDFTINSLLLDLSTNEILDITGKGLSDLKQKLIRTTSTSSRVFREDPLRILRAVRFAAQLDFDLDSEIFESIKKEHSQIKTLSIERINSEFSKLLICSNPVKGLTLLAETGLYKSLIPELEEMFDLKQNKYHDKNVWHHTLSVVENVPDDLSLRLSALFHDIGKKRCMEIDDGYRRFHGHQFVSAAMAEKILRRLKFSKEITGKVSFLIKNHMRTKAFDADASKMSPKAGRKFLRDTGKYCDPLLALIHADNLSHAPEFCYPAQVSFIKSKLSELKKEMEKTPIPVDGKDIREIFKLEGKDIGIALSIAEDIFIDNPSISKNDLLKMIRINLKKQ